LKCRTNGDPQKKECSLRYVCGCCGPTIAAVVTARQTVSHDESQTRAVQTTNLFPDNERQSQTSPPGGTCGTRTRADQSDLNEIPMNRGAEMKYDDPVAA